MGNCEVDASLQGAGVLAIVTGANKGVGGCPCRHAAIGVRAARVSPLAGKGTHILRVRVCCPVPRTPLMITSRCRVCLRAAPV